MKLRNKKTGEIKELKDVMSDMIDNHIVPTLIAIENEWEDYEEPKEYWYIDYDGGILCGESDNSSAEKMMNSIGNHFDSLEEAEKAAEKLKAWKRLKDKGFRFDKWVNVSGDGCSRPIWFYFEKDTALEDIESDLDLLFSEVKNE